MLKKTENKKFKNVLIINLKFKSFDGKQSNFIIMFAKNVIFTFRTYTMQGKYCNREKIRL